MDIALKLHTPPPKLSGFDETISKLTAIKTLIGEIDGMKKLALRVDVSAPGLKSLQTDLAGAKANAAGLDTALRAAGRGNWADQLSKGAITAGEVAQKAAMELRGLGNAYDEARTKSVRYQGMFESVRADRLDANQIEKLPKARAAVNSAHEAETAALTQLRQMERVAAMATTMSGASGLASETHGLAAADAKVTSASNLSAEALANQSAVISQKIKATQGLAAETAKLAEGEKKLAEESKAAKAALASPGVGGAGGALLSQRYVTGEDGERTLAQVRTRGSTPGTTLTQAGVTLTEDISRVEELKTAFKQLDREFAERASMLRKNGAGEEEMAQLWRQQAQELRGLAAATGLSSDAFVVDRQRQAALLEGRAALVDSTRKLRAENAAAARAEFDRVAPVFDGPKRIQRGLTPDGGQTQTTSMQRDVDGFRETVRLTEQFDRSGRLASARLDQINAKLADTGRQAGWAGRTFLNNTKNFLAWTSSAAVTFAAFNGISRAGEALAKVERQTAVLRSVFRGAEGDVMGLRGEVLGLAVAMGRSSDEAMDAAVRWARLGLTQKEVTEAVTISLKAANVAEVDAAAAAEQLSAIYAAYGLRVGDLRVLLNELNTVSNNYNVTNKDLLSGVARSSAIAKQAGLSFSELIGVIGAGVGRTGRSGAEMGNAIKAIIVSLSNPALQEFLGKEFNIQAKTDTGEMKNFSQMLQELYVRYQDLANAERQELLQKVGGKQQASRLQAILDGYIQSQYLSIRALLDQNSAERENLNIRKAMTSQLASLGAAFDKLVVDLANASATGRTFDTSTNAALVRFVELLSNVLKVGDAMPTATLGLMSLFGVMGARLLVANAAMADGATKANFLAASYGQLRAVWSDMGKAMVASNLSNAGMFGGLVGKVSKGGGRMGTVAGFLLSSIPKLVKFAGIMIAVQGVMEGVNWVFRKFASDSEQATAKLAGFNEEMERLRGLSQASQLRARLADTVARALPNVSRRNPRGASELVGRFAEGVEDDRAKQASLKQELQALLQIGDVEGAVARVRQKGAEVAERAMQVRAEEVGVIQEQRRELEAKSADIQRRLDNTLMSDAKRLELIATRNGLEQKAVELTGKQGEQLAAMADEEERAAASVDKRVQAYDALVKARIATGDDLAGALPADGELGRFDAQSAAIEANIQSVERLMRAEEERGRSFTESSRETVKWWEEQVAAAESVLGVRREARTLERKGELRMAQAGLQSGFPESWKPLIPERQRAADLRKKASDAEVALGMSAAEQLRYAEDGLKNVKARIAGEELLNDQRIEALTPLQQELDAQTKLRDLGRQRAAAMDAVERGRRAANLVGVGNNIGLTETEQRMSQAMASGRALSARREGGTLEQIDATARAEGALTTQVLAQSEARQLQLNALNAQRSNTERILELNSRIVNEQRKQNEEASKALILASREDQLRAALLAKYLKGRGGKGFSAQEFMFLSPETQKAVQQFTPGAAPSQLNPTAELEQERAMAIENQRAFSNLIQTMTTILGRFGAVAMPQGGAETPGNLNVTLGFGAQAEALGAILRDAVLGRLEPELARMRAQVNELMGQRNLASAQGVWTGIS